MIVSHESKKLAASQQNGASHQERTENAKKVLLNDDLFKLQSRSIELKLDAVCEFCNQSVLSRKFVAFECCHAFHVDCCEQHGVVADEDCPLCGYLMIDS